MIESVNQKGSYVAVAVHQSLDLAAEKVLFQTHNHAKKKIPKQNKAAGHEGPFFRIGIKLKLPSLLKIRRRASFI